jgi:hypothetical protein
MTKKKKKKEKKKKEKTNKYTKTNKDYSEGLKRRISKIMSTEKKYQKYPIEAKSVTPYDSLHKKKEEGEEEEK